MKRRAAPGRRPALAAQQIVTLRLDVDDVTKLDALTREHMKRTGVATTRADLLREAVREFVQLRGGLADVLADVELPPVRKRAARR